uniref:jupiter microtubule associated homolog 1-like isoform X1 n=1 Tax=Oncorhynchus gorbuscha TaxID=8017 RepID=UPI001EAF477B|nr:jupiter microtubule associated homolog 1-like isoform X1 [Oncorhynchus gorbuscha]
MTTTTIYSGMEAGAKSSSRVLRPPGGASNISFGNDEEKPPNRKNKMASNIFAEPDDPHAHRRNNPPGSFLEGDISRYYKKSGHRVWSGQQLTSHNQQPDQCYGTSRCLEANGGKPTGVLCGEPSAPLRRCAAQSSSNNHEDSNAGNGDNDMGNADNAVEVVPTSEQRDESPQPSAGAPQPAAGASQPAAGMTSGRRNPQGGKSSLILG